MKRERKWKTKRACGYIGGGGEGKQSSSSSRERQTRVVSGVGGVVGVRRDRMCQGW